ncbi:hypothetical protein SAMN05421504_107367 [Amycolatopsis xylanica]|uniref:Uncharacterized protein n=1 Tax=Amycolatopsis xylanica TaxID=589385 RepID=A0A1H3NM90_9PSEU|nr:hypothetical protein SAMN05421504_107367 [Amycolatopsis xylanica]
MLQWGILAIAVVVPAVVCLRRATRTLDTLLTEELAQRPNGHHDRRLPLSSSSGPSSDSGCAGA